MKRLLFLAALAASAAFAQVNHYVSSTGDVSLSTAATAATIQQPAANGKNVALEAATVYCSAACSVTHSVNGTAASATAGTPVSQPGNTGAAARATFWTASNAGSGTTLRVDHVPAGGTFSYAFPDGFRLPAGAATSNYTISIASMTGTVNITFTHAEAQ